MHYRTFWFFRTIAAYWEDCIIISPENVRKLYLDKVESLYKQYFGAV
jgi:predicted DNA-binding transcriptional regulator YafY